tara:strand:- start:410 stop:667 length:258 start_codon:yes stop_codon:yes gene_type:complete
VCLAVFRHYSATHEPETHGVAPRSHAIIAAQIPGRQPGGHAGKRRPTLAAFVETHESHVPELQADTDELHALIKAINIKNIDLDL